MDRQGTRYRVVSRGAERYTTFAIRPIFLNRLVGTQFTSDVPIKAPLGGPAGAPTDPSKKLRIPSAAGAFFQVGLMTRSRPCFYRLIGAVTGPEGRKATVDTESEISPPPW